jgi:hypothetical protein
MARTRTTQGNPARRRRAPRDTAVRSSRSRAASCATTYCPASWRRRPATRGGRGHAAARPAREAGGPVLRPGAGDRQRAEPHGAPPSRPAPGRRGACTAPSRRPTWRTRSGARGRSASTAARSASRSRSSSSAPTSWRSDVFPEVRASIKAQVVPAEGYDFDRRGGDRARRG